jgi:CelD/BcsL family acetyltransferase involved in cellulose biosynthesis
VKAKVIRNIQELNAIEYGWNNLLENFRHGDVGYSFKWFQNWINSFLDPQSIRVVAIEGEEQLLSVMPLYTEKVPYLKIKLPVLKSMTNWHSHRFDMLARDNGEELFIKTIKTAFKTGRENLMLLQFVPKDSQILKWLESVCKKMNWKYIITEHSTNCQVLKAPTFDEYYEQLDSKFKRNVRAAEKKAQSKSKPTLCQLKSKDELDNFLERGFAIEASGWKGSNGTAINNNDSVKKFYAGVAKDLYDRGEFQAYLLKDDQDDLAFLYCIKGFGNIRALKIGSNENFRAIAPGMLITKEVLTHLHNEGNFNVWDFCGGQARWKKDWGTASETLYNVTIYNNNLLGKLLFYIGAFTKKYVS